MNERNNLSVTAALLIINIAVFVLGMFVQTNAVLGMPHPAGDETSIFYVYGSYSWYTCFMELEIWRLISYQFVHANLGHLVFNMFGLYFFGSVLEHFMGDLKFLAYYLICGVAGALFSSFLSVCGFFPSMIPWELIPMVGASASIYGVLMAVAVMMPRAEITLLFPPVTLTLRTFALLILGYAVITILFNWNNAGGEAGHLGGAIMGIIITLIWRERVRRQYWR